jgi:MFS family permease
VLAARDARLYLTGQVLSQLGDSVLWMALGIWVKELTGSAAAAGLSFFALALGSLCGPLGGMLADRMRRRRLLIVTNLASACLVLALLLVRDRHQVWLIYAVLVGYGVSGAVLGPAQSGLLQAIVPADLLGDANGALQTAQQGFRLVTPLAGAGLFAVIGPAPLVIGDAVTFLVAAGALLILRITEPEPQRGGERWMAELTAGARHLTRTTPLRQLTLTAAIVVTAYGLSEAPFFAVVSQGLHRPTPFLGILVSLQGVGAIAAGVTAATLMRRLSEGLLAGLGMISAAIGFVLLLPPDLASILAGCALLGASLTWITVGIMTALQRGTPPALMGRANAAFTLAYATPQTMAIALGAGLLAIVSFRYVLLVNAGLMAMASAYLLTRAEQRRTQPAALNLAG